MTTLVRKGCLHIDNTIIFYDFKTKMSNLVLIGMPDRPTDIVLLATVCGAHHCHAGEGDQSQVNLLREDKLTIRMNSD